MKKFFNRTGPILHPDKYPYIYIYIHIHVCVCMCPFKGNNKKLKSLLENLLVIFTLAEGVFELLSMQIHVG